MQFIDTHGHVYFDKYKDEKADLIQRMEEAQVAQVYMPGIDHSEIDHMLEMEARFPEVCLPMMGLHPCYVKKEFERELYIIEDWLAKRPFLAVGEIGFDLYWDKTFLEQQREAFDVQVGLAKEHQLPIAIHCRDAFDINYEALQKHLDGQLTGVWHCFAENLDRAQKVIDAGFYLGLNGIATFKNGGLDKVIPHVDLEHIVLETDCPFLAPAPHRGKRNEPAYIPLIAQRIAELKGVSVEEVAEVTTRNAQRLFQPEKMQEAKQGR